MNITLSIFIMINIKSILTLFRKASGKFLAPNRRAEVNIVRESRLVDVAAFRIFDNPSFVSNHCLGDKTRREWLDPVQV